MAWREMQGKIKNCYVSLQDQASAVVFLPEGTLIDRSDGATVAINYLLRRRGGRALAREETAALLGEGDQAFLERAFRASGQAPEPSAIPELLAAYRRALSAARRPAAEVPGAYETIETITAIGLQVRTR